MKIGFVGLGNMGNAIAVNLLKAGHQLFINDLARELQSNLEIQGARWRDDLVKLGSEAEVVFTALPGAAEVTAVMLGDQGVLAGMKAGTCYIDLGTNDDATLAGGGRGRCPGCAGIARRHGGWRRQCPRRQHDAGRARRCGCLRRLRATAAADRAGSRASRAAAGGLTANRIPPPRVAGSATEKR